MLKKKYKCQKSGLNKRILEICLKFGATFCVVSRTHVGFYFGRHFVSVRRECLLGLEFFLEDQQNGWVSGQESTRGIQGVWS